VGLSIGFTEASIDRFIIRMLKVKLSYAP
jgi:hypothetical protein